MNPHPPLPAPCSLLRLNDTSRRDNNKLQEVPIILIVLLCVWNSRDNNISCQHFFRLPPPHTPLLLTHHSLLSHLLCFQLSLLLLLLHLLSCLQKEERHKTERRSKQPEKKSTEVVSCYLLSPPFISLLTGDFSSETEETTSFHCTLHTSGKKAERGDVHLACMSERLLPGGGGQHGAEMRRSGGRERVCAHAERLSAVPRGRRAGE